MLVDLLRAYNEVEEELEVFRIEVTTRLGKKVYRYDKLSIMYERLTIWYAVELDDTGYNDLIFELSVDLDNEIITVGLDDLQYYESYEYGIIKDCLKILK
jgi:hypothetical protein